MKVRRIDVIKKAIKHYDERLFDRHDDDDLNVTDSLVYALEEFDTGYDLTEVGYNQLVKDVKKSLTEYVT